MGDNTVTNGAPTANFASQLTLFVKHSANLSAFDQKCKLHEEQLIAAQAAEDAAQKNYDAIKVQYTAAEDALEAAVENCADCETAYDNCCDSYYDMRILLEEIVSHQNFIDLVAVHDVNAMFIKALMETTFLSDLHYTGALYSEISKRVELILRADLVCTKSSNTSQVHPANTLPNTGFDESAPITSLYNYIMSMPKNGFIATSEFGTPFAYLAYDMICVYTHITAGLDYAGDCAPDIFTGYHNSANKQWYALDRRYTAKRCIKALCKVIIDSCQYLMYTKYLVHNTEDLVVFHTDSGLYAYMTRKHCNVPIDTISVLRAKRTDPDFKQLHTAICAIVNTSIASSATTSSTAAATRTSDTATCKCVFNACDKPA